MCRIFADLVKNTNTEGTKSTNDTTPYFMEEPNAYGYCGIFTTKPNGEKVHSSGVRLCPTHYPEAFDLKSIDAEHVAEPGGWSSQQNTNGPGHTNLLAELYNMIHVKAIRTSPYHPQTDAW